MLELDRNKAYLHVFYELRAPPKIRITQSLFKIGFNSTK